MLSENSKKKLVRTVKSANSEMKKFFDFHDNIAATPPRTIEVYGQPTYNKIMSYDFAPVFTATVGLELTALLYVVQYLQDEIHAYQHSTRYLKETLKDIDVSLGIKPGSFHSVSKQFFNQEALQSLAGEIAPHLKLTLNKNNNDFLLTLDKKKRKSIPLAPTSSIKRLTLSPLEEKVQQLTESRFGRFVSSAWNVMNAGSMSGWFSWSVLHIFYKGLDPFLYLLGYLPLLGGMGLQAVDEVLSEENNKELERARRQIIRARLWQLYYAQLSEKITDQLTYEEKEQLVEEEKQQEEKAKKAETNSQKILSLKNVPAYARRLLGDSLFYSRPVQIAFGAITGGLNAYISSFFASWPIMMLLVAAGVMAPIFPIGSLGLILSVAIPFAITAAIGIYGAFQGGVQASIDYKNRHNYVLDNGAMLMKFQRLKKLDLALRKETQENYAQIAKLAAAKKTIGNLLIPLASYEPKIAEQTIDENKEFQRTKQLPNVKQSFSLRFTHYVDKACGAVLQIARAFPGFTGSLTWRSIAQGGAYSLLGVIGVSVAPLPFIIVGASCALIWASYKLVEYIKNKTIKRDYNLIEKTAANCATMNAEIKYLFALKKHQEACLAAANKGPGPEDSKPTAASEYKVANQKGKEDEEAHLLAPEQTQTGKTRSDTPLESGKGKNKNFLARHSLLAAKTFPHNIQCPALSKTSAAA